MMNTNDRAPSSATLASSTRDLLLELTVHLYALGPKSVFELCCEIHQGADLLSRLEAYGRLDTAIVKYFGADRLRPTLRVIK